jgi:hypothetical protein
MNQRDELSFNDDVKSGKAKIYDFPGSAINVIVGNSTTTLDIQEKETATTSIKRLTYSNSPWLATGFPCRKV